MSARSQVDAPAIGAGNSVTWVIPLPTPAGPSPKHNAGNSSRSMDGKCPTQELMPVPLASRVVSPCNQDNFSSNVIASAAACARSSALRAGSSHGYRGTFGGGAATAASATSAWGAMVSAATDNHATRTAPPVLLIERARVHLI